MRVVTGVVLFGVVAALVDVGFAVLGADGIYVIYGGGRIVSFSYES